MQADAAWRSAQATSLTSLTALRQVLTTLARFGGDKMVVLISGGLPLDERDQMSLLVERRCGCRLGENHVVHVLRSRFERFGYQTHDVGVTER